ncbi:thrombospondin type 3 repeat-containing protein [Haliangium ochraceum]|nr:thrombospondin type 3 repeat-containing protein [Haliangium ochraceum]
MPFALVAVLSAGCSFSPAPLDPVDGDGGAPPVDAADAAPPDADIDALPVDSDGDTIPDPVDNCPTDPNQDQADCDEDGTGDACDPDFGNDYDSDGVPDTCDNCPSKANADQADVLDGDGQGDGVGDECDPHPDDDGDSIAYFEDFAGTNAGLPAGWTLATGGAYVDPGWTVENGLLTQSTLGDGISIVYLDTDVPDDLVLETRLLVHELTPDTGKVPAFSLLTRYDNGLAAGESEAGFSCAFQEEYAQNRARMRIASFDDGDAGTRDLPAGSVAAGTTYEMLLEQRGQGDGGETPCTIIPVNPAGEVQRKDDTEDLAGPASGRVALRVTFLRAGFDYVLIYGQTP